MRILPQWVLWRFERVGTKWTKVPLQRNGQRASSTDPSTWTDFKTAAKVAAASGGKTGVGFVLTGDGITCFDLDNVYDPEADAIKPWADDIISTLGSYYEMSPTGTGAKVYVKGTMPEGMGTRFPHPDGDGEVEVFANRRFLCVTGQPFLDSDSEVRERESAVRVVAGMLRSWKAQRTEPKKPVAAIPAERTQDRRQLMERATRYLQACPPAIQGSGGDLATFKIAQHPTRGFLLTESEAYDAMQEWNSRCEPPWEEHDLRRKIHEAANAGTNVAPGEHLQSDQTHIRSVNGKPLSVYREPDAPDAESAAEDELPPDDLITIQSDPGPIPDELLSPPGFIGDMAAWILRTSHRPQPEFALASAIATFSTLVARKIRDRTNCRTNVYFGCVGETGSGKERPREAAKDLFSECGMVQHLVEGFRSGAAVLSALQRNPVSLALWDEMGAGLEAIRNSKQAHWLAEIINNLLKVYTSAGTTFVGENYADADKQQHIIQPHLSLLGSTTESTLFNALSEYLVANGFINRTLFFWARPNVRIGTVRYERCPVELVDVATHWRDYNPRGNLAGRAPDSPPIPDFVEYDADAQQHLERYIEQCDDRREQMKHEWERALRIRQVEQVRRLALLHGISIDPEYRMIGFESVDWAIKIVDHCTDRLIWHASTRIAENEYAGDMLKVLSFIRGCSTAGATQQEIARRFRGIKAQSRKDLLAHLLEAGDVVAAEVKTKGRSKHVYRVSEPANASFREESPLREGSREESFDRNGIANSAL